MRSKVGGFAAMRCPCRKPSETKTYANCCEAHLAGHTPAPTAEALMRSRFTASVQKNGAYLLSTWHPRTRPPSIDFPPGLIWLSLKIGAVEAGTERSTVSFVARSRLGGRTGVLIETSRFVREDGRWFYVDGDIGGPVGHPTTR